MNFLVKHRLFALVLLLLASLAMWPGVRMATVPDNSLSVWFLSTDPALNDYHSFQKVFGNDEFIILSVHEPGGVFTSEALTRIKQVSDHLTAIEGIARVISVLSVPEMPATPRPDAVQETKSSDELQDKRRNALANPWVRNVLVNEDATRALLMIQMSVMDDIDSRRDSIVAAVYDLVDEVYAGKEHALGGIGVIYSGLNVLTQHDFGIFISLGYMIMFGMLWVVFRNYLLVLASLGVIVIGNLFALGIMGAMGHQINMVTVVLPTLIIVLGIADAVHFPVAYVRLSRERREDESDLEITSRALRVAFKPCFMTTLTSIACFIGLATSPMVTIRHLGIYASIGLAACLLATVVLMANVFAWLGSRQLELPEFRRTKLFLDNTRVLLSNHGPALIFVTILLTGISLWGARLVETDTYTMGYLPADHRVVQDHRQIEKDWGPYSQLEFTVQPVAGVRADDPAILTGMERFVEQASLHPKISHGRHLAELYRYVIHLALPELPLGQQLEAAPVNIARQILEGALGSDAGAPLQQESMLSRYITPDGKIARITLSGEMMSAVQLRDLLSHLEGVAKDSLGGLARVQATGYPPLYVKIIDYVMTSQIQGFSVALVLIFVFLLVWLRSFRMAVIALPVNVLPVVVMMGVMGFAGINLDVATATVAAIVIGVAIDDTVHFLYQWRAAERGGADWTQSLNSVFDSTGRAACITTLLIVTGFPALMLANVYTVFAFGLLTTVSAVAALYGDLVLLPLLLRMWTNRTHST